MIFREINTLEINNVGSVVNTNKVITGGKPNDIEKDSWPTILIERRVIAKLSKD